VFAKLCAIKKNFSFVKLIRKSSFFFGNFSRVRARLHLRHTPSSFIVTLTDLKNNVIFCCTSRSMRHLKSKKQRRSPYVIEPIFLKVYEFLKLYKIKFVDLVLKMRINSHIHFLLKELNFSGIVVFKIFESYCLPHNGMRGRKTPRK
jgi:ribosomal protein S11